MIPEGPKVRFADCLKPGQDLARAIAEDETARQIVELARAARGPGAGRLASTPPAW